MTAFPQYRLSDLNNMRRDEYLQLFAMATWSLRELRGMPVQVVPVGDQPQPPQQHRRLGAIPPFTNLGPPQGP